MSTSLMRRNRFDVWNPWRTLEELESRMWDWMSTPTGFTPMNRLLGETSSYVPPVDVYEVGDDLFVAASLPGIDPSKVEVQVQNGVLSISGEQTPLQPQQNGAETEQPQVRTHIAGIPRFGQFSFRFSLPYEVDVETSSAVYQDGILRIRFPKPEQAKPRRISVAVQPSEQTAVGAAPTKQIEARGSKKQ
jgi:HSP20 family protein